MYVLTLSYCNFFKDEETFQSRNTGLGNVCTFLNSGGQLGVRITLYPF